MGARVKIDAGDARLEEMERERCECGKLAKVSVVLDLRNNGRTAVVENACLACATGFLARLRDSLRSGREAELEKALRDVLAVCRDRQAFAMMGPRAFAKAEQIAKAALGEK
jgi:hypothetical protein